MNYYSHHIGDYLLDTAHLSILEDGVYRRLMDRYYTTEKALPLDEQTLCRVIRASAEEEKEAVRSVLAEFFQQTPDGWAHKRCEEEITLYQAKAEKNKVNGAKGGRPVKEAKAEITQVVNLDNPEITQVVSENNPDITLTKNQEPRTKSRGSRLAPDWVPSGEEIDYCTSQRPDLDPEITAMKFKNYWLGRAGKDAVKADWLATWRNWVLNEKQGPNKPPAKRGLVL